MLEFARLLDQLLFTTGTLRKRRLMAQYFTARPDPERGYALGALTGGLRFPVAKPNLIRELIGERVDPVLYTLSRDYVGDMAETVALLWPAPPQPAGPAPSLAEVIAGLSQTDRAAIRYQLAGWLDALDSTGRWALLKLITGNIRIGVSLRLAQTALADAFNRGPDDIAQIWHGLEPPYDTLWPWLAGAGPAPEPARHAAFLPMMLAHPLEDEEFQQLDLAAFQIELKWDGIRVQLARAGDQVALYSRTGEDISHAFPDIEAAALALGEDDFALDGELLTRRDGAVASFNHLQQRLNRKKVTPQLLKDFPAFIRLYDMLRDSGQDLRALPLHERRQALEAWHARHQSPLMDLSEVLAAPDRDALAAIREKARQEAQHGVEGLMLKRKASPYLAGRPRGHWFKWKRQTLTLDCVLMYAQRGSGKRSSFYSDYTFGVWQPQPEGAQDPPQLVPVGKAYSGFTDAELTQLDKWIRGHTSNRFGPVREVTPALVLEIEFDSIHASTRHKSGLAMRFPRVHRVRWDKPADEADTLATALTLAT